MKKLFFALCALAALAMPAQAQIFYKISGNGLAKPSYIFGTHHLAPLSVIDSIPSARKALGEVDRVIGEIDMTMDQMQLGMAMQPYMMAPSDSTLRDLIAPADYERISKVFTQYAPMPGMTLDMLGMMRPMVATSTVSVGIIGRNMPGYKPGEQLDIYFQQEAKKAGKDVAGLETPQMQAELLYTSTPLTTQAKDLVELLDNPLKVVESGKKLNEKYLAQDIEGLLELSDEEQSAEEKVFMEALLDKRNANWLKALPAMLGEKSNFIAVGALHLPGAKGVVEGLRKLGYTVEPVMEGVKARK